MINLYRSFMYRFTKDKIFTITIIVNFAVTLLGLIFLKFQNRNELLAYSTGRASLLTSFHPTTNMGILIPILLYIILQREYSHHTLRNKIISGYSRLQIYTSYTLAAITTGILFLFTNMLLQLLLSNTFFGYGTEFTIAEFAFVIKTFLFSLLLYCFYFSLVSVLTHLFKLVGFVIYMVIILALELLNLYSSFTLDESFYNSIKLLNPVKLTSELTLANQDTPVLLFSILIGVVYTFAISTIGYQIFRKADIK